VTVSDAQLVEAMQFSFERLKLVLEPGGAAALAALLAGEAPLQSGSRVGVILSGGNVGAASFCELVGSGPVAIARAPTVPSEDRW
jgi:threonine dehydratase